MLQGTHRLPLCLRRTPCLPVDSRSFSPLVFRHSLDRERLCAVGASDESLQAPDVTPVPRLCCLRDSCLQPTDHPVRVCHDIPCQCVQLVEATSQVLASIPTSVEVERVKGIEPSSHAWEARALPLSYTRPFPKGMDYPQKRVVVTLRGGLHNRPVSRQATAWKSAPFWAGQLSHPVSVPLQNGIRFLHDPLPATAVPDHYDRVCRDSLRRRYGLTLFRAASTSQEAPAFLPVIVLSACSHQAQGTSDHVPFGQSLSVDLAPQQLDGIYQRFTLR